MSIIFIFSILLTLGFSQDISIEKIHTEFLASRDTNRLLFIAHPDDSSEINLNQFRFGAWVRDTTATVTVQGRSVKIWPSGAVADWIELDEGWNTVPFVVRTSNQKEETTLHLYRRPGLKQPNTTPAKILDTLMIPAGNQLLLGENLLTVSFRGSPEGSATCFIKGLTPQPMPLAEVSPGKYSTTLRVPGGKALTNRKIKFRLKDSRGHSDKAVAPGKVTILPGLQPRVVRTNEDHTLVYFTPGGEIFLDLQAGITLELKEEYQGWCRVLVDEKHSAYVEKSSLDYLPAGESLPKSLLYGMSSSEDENWVYFSFRTSGPVPYDILHHLAPNRVTVRLFRAHFQDEWSVYPESNTVMEYLDWVQETDETLRLDFVLQHEQSWGYKTYFSGNRLVVALRKPPVIQVDRPFAGLRIALDAGHGGEHKGAMGATGLLEKNVNLVYTYYVKGILEQEGATVILTRPDDRTMGLRERMDIAEAEEAQLFLWLHNNSTGLSRHPEDLRGTSTYYTSLQGLSFARAIYPHLKALGLEAEGLVHRSYFMTRQTAMPVILVEGAFLSHPEDEMFLLQDENLKHLAQAVVNGLRDRLVALSRESFQEPHSVSPMDR